MEDPSTSLRIARFLARCGVASRRQAEELVRAGRVTLNGAVFHDLGRQVDPATDRVAVDGRPVSLAAGHLTLAMNKPLGVVVTRRDPEGRRTVYDILPAEHQSRAAELVYAGRLDVYTSGLLLLTTDGDLANRLTHPSHGAEKGYETETVEELSADALETLRGGVDVGDFRARPCRVTRLAGPEPVYRIVLKEGKNRQVRRMIEAVGGRIARLRRIAVGQLTLGRLRLREGQVRALTPEEVESCFLPMKD